MLANGWIIVVNPHVDFPGEGDCTLYIEYSERKKLKTGGYNLPKRPNDGTVRETLASGWFEEGLLYDEFAEQPWYQYRQRIGKVVLLDEWRPLNARYLFDGLNNCEKFDLLKLNTADCSSFEGMFRGCSSVETLFDLDRMDTSNITSISQMFLNCLKLRAVSIAGWNTEKIVDTDNVLSGCNTYVLANEHQHDFLKSIVQGSSENGIWVKSVS